MCAARIEHFPAPAGYERVEPPAPWKPRFNPLFLDELDKPGPEFEWLISGWLSIGDKSIIGGPSQSGKSFLAIHAGMCIAFGVPFFGADVKQGLVIYIAGEGARGVKKRLRAWRRHFGVEFGRETPFVLIQTPVNLYAADGDTSALIAEIEGIADQFPNSPLRLVVIDTLATAAVGADENASRDMGIVMSNVGKVNEFTRAAVCIVHHMNASGEKLRGSTSIYAALDSSIYVKRNEETKIRTARLGKQKDDESDLSFQFELMSVEIGRDAEDKPVTSCVCLPVGVKEVIRREEERKGFRLSDPEVTFMRCYFDAEKQFGQPVPVDMGLPDGVRSIVPYNDVKRIYSDSNPSDDVSPEAGDDEIAKAKDARRKLLSRRLKTAREALTKVRVIGAGKHDEKDVVWFTGKPLRAFPQTIPREIEATPPGDVPEIPF